MWKASRKSQNEAKRQNQPAGCHAEHLAQVAARLAEDRDALLEVLPEALDAAGEQRDQDDQRRSPTTVSVNSSSSGWAAQNEISKAGSSGSRGGRGSSPWVIA